MESPRFLNRWALTLWEKQGKTRQHKRTKTAKYFIQDLLFGTKTMHKDISKALVFRDSPYFIIADIWEYVKWIFPELIYPAFFLTKAQRTKVRVPKDTEPEKRQRHPASLPSVTSVPWKAPREFWRSVEFVAEN
jgi:hypothetical protein